MIIGFIVFGDKLDNYKELFFSILSILKNAKEGNSIVVLTDHADYLAVFGDKVKAIQITHQEFDSWKGNDDYFWRIKIKGIQYLAELFPADHILYMDADTYIYGNLQWLSDAMLINNGIMHREEAKLSKIKSKTMMKLYKDLKGKSYAGYKVDADSYMWNAGVIGISVGNKKLLESVLQACDDISEQGVKSYYREQFAFSLVLQNATKMVEAKSEIVHYWSNKEMWNTYIENTIVKSYFQNRNLAQTILDIDNEEILRLPEFVKISNTRRRLIKKLERWFPDLY